MGASLSTVGTKGATIGPGLGDIPESCVACVFLYLTPPQICNLASLNRAFRGAASADSVWEAKLPPNYQDLLDLMPPDRYQNLSKKDIFALLSRPVPFDDGNKEVWLDRITGKVCVSISAKAMAITGIDDRRYWNWIPTEESRDLLIGLCFHFLKLNTHTACFSCAIAISDWFQTLKNHKVELVLSFTEE